MRRTNMGCLAILAGVGLLAAAWPTQDVLGKPTPPGSCDPDCNYNGIPDPCDLSCSGEGTSGAYPPCLTWSCAGFTSCGLSYDCNGDNVPDDCQLDGNDCNGNYVPDDCEDEACCFANEACSILPPACCAGLGGASAGPGTTCASGICGEYFACCNTNHAFCDNHRIFECADEGGTVDPSGADCADLPDEDIDGVPDSCDNCEYFNPTQADGDGDGYPDACDNCPLVDNPDQGDCNGDMQGDCCDSDDDGDGVFDSLDDCPGNHKDYDVDANGRPIGDLDFDCDVDDADLAILNNNLNPGSNCYSGLPSCP